MKIIFHTNLDEARRDISNLNKLNSQFKDVPRIKEYIIFPFEKWDHESKRSRNFEFSLEVVSVQYNYFTSSIEVELHIPRIPTRSVADWTVWFRKFRLGKDY